MNFEEKAKQVMRELDACGYNEDVAVIVSALQEAAREEREACADEIEILKTALKPFASEANSWGGGIGDIVKPVYGLPGSGCDFCGKDPGYELADFTVGDLRHARDILCQASPPTSSNSSSPPALHSSSEWQPIETAPKDGTQIDLWCQVPGLSGGGCRVIDCWFSDSHWWRYDDSAFGDDQCRSRVHNITHWRFPSASPKSSDEERSDEASNQGKDHA